MIRKEKKLLPFKQKLNDWVTKYFTTIPFIQKIIFVEHLQIMLHAGLSLNESLETLNKEISNKKLKKIIEQIKLGVEKGERLSDVLFRYPKAFPPIYVKMIASGEIAGKLEESLQQITLQMKKSQELISSIHGAMIYPMVILTAMGGIGIMMVTVVLPKLMILFEDFHAKLPLSTRILIAITHFMSNPINLIILAVTIASLITGYIFSLKKFPTFRKIIHKIILYLPIAGPVIKKINLARFSMTLSSLLKSTIPIVDATNISADTCGNVLYKQALHKAAEKIKTGIPLSNILKEYPKLFPPMVIEMIMVGEQTGEIDQLLTELSNFYSKEIDKTMRNFTQIIEPVIIILLGIAVAGMAVAIIMPMYSLAENF